MLRILMAGTRQMRAAGETYLPKYDSETATSYANRLARAVLTNYFEDAVRNVSAMPFRRNVTLKDASPELEGIMADVDLNGNDLHKFASDVFEDSVVAGLGYIFVDYPKSSAIAPPGRKPTIADVKKSNARPYWVQVTAENVLSCYFSIHDDGKIRMVYARILEETHDEPIPGVFTESVTRRVRELFFNDLGQPSWRLYRQSVNEKGEQTWVVDEEGVFTISRLPFVPVIAGRRRQDGTVKPLFLDLGFKQIEHYQSSSDQRNILTASRFPILAVAGAKPEFKADEKPAFGPYTLLFTEDAQGKWYWVEVQGTAIAQGQKDLEVLTDELRVMGLQPVIADTGGVTATARSIDESRAHTSIEKAAINLNDALNQALALTEEWLGSESEATVTVNRDFGLSLTAKSEIDSLLKMRATGEISRETFWLEMKRRGVLNPDFDDEKEKLMIESESLGGDVPEA